MSYYCYVGTPKCVAFASHFALQTSLLPFCSPDACVAFQNFMAEAAAASPGHKFDSIPSYLPAPRSPQPDILRTSYIEKESGVAEQRLQTIYWKFPSFNSAHTPDTVNSVRVYSPKVLIWSFFSFRDSLWELYLNCVLSVSGRVYAIGLDSLVNLDGYMM